MDTPPITLRQVWRDYQTVRVLKEHTIYDYTKKLKSVEDWMDLDMNSITKSMVEQRHRELSSAPYYANSIFRIIRTLYNYALVKYEDDDTGVSLIKRNPVRRLSEMRYWNKEKARSRHVPFHKMKDWFDGVLLLNTPVFRDYLIFLLLTGLRKEEAAKLTWDNVDLEYGFMYFKQTKNGEDHHLPTSTFILELLKERKAASAGMNQFVFPGGRWGTNGSIKSPYKAIAKVTDYSGVKFSPHDLRRTFNSLGVDLRIEEAVRKRLLNHSAQDVTNKHYHVPNPEVLREPMEQISQHALKLAQLM
jgi:integrase